ncbi:TonB-dependent receptor [Marinobacter sp. ATCH36]|uniref:TonB-dependent siderophore receptor n=1 Tax=Marinobacter sp. ATCH36 TaxID=2945106 RepID=UPI00202206D0|nr:TonB-dependent receptor [Marinobacter sp. ATCH36]MCL7942448.1 TonB-dependent receptor [Marinobacter sp. ATCH36]
MPSFPTTRVRLADQCPNPFRLKPLTFALRASLFGVGLALAWTPMNLAQAQVEEQKSYTIPAGPLAQSLNQFASEAGITLSFDPAMVEGKRALALLGRYGVDQGLEKLLAGTGLSARFADANTVILHNGENKGALTTLPELTISGDSVPGSAGAAYRSEAASVGVLGNKSLQNTPYSVDVYSRELMDNLQARSLSDVTKLDASVTSSAGDLVAENNTLAIRGLSPDFDTGQKLDGMNFRSRAKDLPLEHVETVEILKGAGGFLYGFGAPGGIINYTLKRPTEAPTRTLNLQLMDSGLALIHGDLGGRFGTEDQFGYRINAVHESGDTYINDGESRRNSASVALDWRITPDLFWQVDALKANHNRVGGHYSVTPNADGQSGNFTPAEPLDPIGGDERLAPEWASYESIQETWGTTLNWQWSQTWGMQIAHRQSDNYRLFHMPGIVANVDGDYTATLYSYNNLFESEQTQLMVSGEANTGFVRHELVAGASYNETVASNSGPLNLFVDLGSGNLSDPEEFMEPRQRLPKSAAKKQEYSRVKRQELFLSDTLRVGQSWDFIAGLRHGNLKDEFGDYDESEITPSLAVIHRPAEWLSVYASYIEAFEQGNVAPERAANAGEVFDPLVSEQLELGVKIGRDDWSANAAVFRLQRGLTYTNSDNIFTQNGEARYEGLELSTKARIGSQWLLSASALWLDARNEKTGDPSLDGERVQGVAREQVKLYGEYRVAGIPLTLSAGAQYVGERPVDPQGRWNVDPVTLFDAGARYDVQAGGTPVTLRLNVENLTDEAFWYSQSGRSSLEQGSPRTIKLGAQIDF